MIAFVDGDDPYHKECASTLATLPPQPFLTTWPCLTEAMHILGREGGIEAQDGLWEYLVRGLIRLYVPHADDWERVQALMKQYADTPMDLADASLVVAAERTSVRKIFCLDQHFRAYRIHGAHAFEIVP